MWAAEPQKQEYLMLVSHLVALHICIDVSERELYRSYKNTLVVTLCCLNSIALIFILARTTSMLYQIQCLLF